MNKSEEIYNICHQKQLAELFKKGFYSQLIHQTTDTKYLIPSLLGCGMYQESTITLMQNENNDPLSLMWIIAGSYMIGMDSTEQEEELKQTKSAKYIEQLEDFTQIVKPLSHSIQDKEILRNKFEKLMENAEQEHYFRIKNMPVFLVPQQWIQSFYNDSFELIPAIDTRSLVQPMAYIDKDPKYMHLNYKLKENCKENVDFTIISFEVWQFLKNQFGGVELRRFNSPQTEASCELWLRQIRVLVQSNGYIHTNWEIRILSSRFDTIGTVVGRVQRILREYQMIGKSDMSKKWEAIKVSRIPTQKLVDILLDEQKELYIEHEKFEGAQLQRLQFMSKIEQSQISEKNYILLLTLNPEPSLINLNKIPFLKVPDYTQPNSTPGQLKVEKQASKETENELSDLLNYYSVDKCAFDWSSLSVRSNGLENLGNTCYLNSALQCLLAIDKFNKYFTSNSHLSDINIHNTLGSEGHLACAYGELVKEYYKGDMMSIEPRKIFRIIVKNNQFRGQNQQDSQQFLNYFLDKLHEDLNKVKNTPCLKEVQSNGRPDKVVSEESWNNYLQRNKSFISENLAGQYRSEITCPDCGIKTITFDTFLSATIPFPKQKIKQQLKGYFLHQEGQFLKVNAKVKFSMNSGVFCEKYFVEKVAGEWLVQKKPVKKWDQSKTIAQNYNEKGVLIFYSRSKKTNIEINYQIDGYKIFNRRIYCYRIESEEELFSNFYLNIKRPLLKALAREDIIDLPLEEYMAKCDELKFVQLIYTSEKLQYPLKQGVYNMIIRINEEKLKDWCLKNPIKFDISSKSYSMKSKLKLRSIDDEISVSELLESFQIPEKLTQQNTWNCNHCKDKKMALKKMQLYKVPEYLILHLKRFDHRGSRQGQKVLTPVRVEEYEIINESKFQLIGIVNHVGNLANGHYTSYAKRNNQWYLFDDNFVKKEEPSGINAYLLFYKQLCLY